jgi:hypothetical protein
VLIEVFENPSTQIGGKVSRIVAADGQKYEIWSDKLDGVTPSGATRSRPGARDGRPALIWLSKPPGKRRYPIYRIPWGGRNSIFGM